MTKRISSALDTTQAVLRRLYGTFEHDGEIARLYTSEPSDNAAVIFSAIVQVRAIDRLTEAVKEHAKTMARIAGRSA